MTAAPEHDLWLDKDAAAALAGVKVRQLERRAAEGAIVKQVLPRAAGERTARVVYSRDSILRFTSGADPEPAQALERRAPAAPPAVNDASNAWGDLAGLLRQIAALPRSAPEPEAEVKPWLTLDEAVAWSGLPRPFLLRGALAGTLPAVNAGTETRRAWRFNRDALGSFAPIQR